MNSLTTILQSRAWNITPLENWSPVSKVTYILNTPILWCLNPHQKMQSSCCILTSDPAKHAIPKTAEVAYSVGVGELDWQYGTRLKSHGIVTNWYTGRRWPVKRMTVFFLLDDDQNMSFQRRRKLHIPLAIYGKRLSGRRTII